MVRQKKQAKALLHAVFDRFQKRGSPRKPLKVLQWPTRMEVPEEGKNKISFQNYHKLMKVSYTIYADFEALVWKMSGCERGSESKSYREKTERHKACGYAYKVVRSDGEVISSGV